MLVICSSLAVVVAVKRANTFTKMTQIFFNNNWWKQSIEITNVTIYTVSSFCFLFKVTDKRQKQEDGCICMHINV